MNLYYSVFQRRTAVMDQSLNVNTECGQHFKCRIKISLIMDFSGFILLIFVTIWVF